MATNQQKYVTRPLHTMRFYQMIACSVVSFVVILICTSSGKLGMGMFGCLGGVVQSCIAISGLRRGQFITPLLSSYSGGGYRKEHRYIINALVISLCITLLLLGILGAVAVSGKLTGNWLIVAAIAVNIYGWFALNWWQEGLNIIVTSQEEGANQITPSLEQPLTTRLRPFTPVNLGAASAQTVRAGTGQGKTS